MVSNVNDCNPCASATDEAVISISILYDKERNIAPKRLIKEQLKGWLAVQGSLAFEKLRALILPVVSGDSAGHANSLLLLNVHSK